MRKLFCAMLAVLAAFGLAGCTEPAMVAETDSDPVETAASASASKVVTFTDSALEAMVRGSMGKPTGDITVAEAESVTRLNLSNEWLRYISEETTIHDINGLEFFKNLESLDLSFHAVTNITPLSGLKRLTSLSLGGCPIDDIAPLAGLTSLKVLTLSGCAAQDYSPLAKLVSLNFLMLDNATITDVSPLVSLTNLKYLYLAGCPISNYFPLSDIYQSLEQKDFIIAFTLAELGFMMDNDGKRAIYDGDRAYMKINHIEWGAPPEDWTKDCVQTDFEQNDYKILVGYYPNSDAYVIMANKDGNQVMNYVYDHANDIFFLNDKDRDSLEQLVRAIFTDTDAEDVLLTPIQTSHDIIIEMLGVSADTLFELPFDETDDTLPNSYERLGFTFLDYKGTYEYEEQTPHELSISIHRQEWDENAPEENRVDWSIAFIDSDVNGFKLLILYFEAEKKYLISIEKDGVQAGFETRPATGEHGWEWPDLDTAHRMFNDAFGTEGKEMYDKSIAYFEQVVQEHFGMSIHELYALPVEE